ncbi:MAG: MotA/TolQ/ExbB proton channel family protein [Planctomycetota bacterium]
MSHAKQPRRAAPQRTASKACATARWIGLVLSLAVATPAVGQTSLAQALADAQAELAAERQRIAAEEEVQNEILDGLVEQQRSLSDRRVDLRLEITALRAKADDLREQRDTRRAEVEPKQRSVKALPRSLRDARRKLDDLLEVLPPSAGVDDLDFGNGELAQFLASLGAVLRESQLSDVQRRTVRGPDGREMQADVARLGLLGWCYRAVDDGRIAVAMNAPGADEAFRWHEDVVPEESRVIAEMFDRVAAGDRSAGPVLLDVTAQMEVESETRQKTWMDTVLAGGPVMVPLAIVALAALALILERLFYLSRVGSAGRLARKVVAHAEAGRFDEATSLCHRRRTPTTRALAACIESRGSGVQAMEDSVQEAILHEMPRLERFLPTIGILASVAPLLGLLGTVTGMILTFEMIATLGSGNPRIMAGGISQALITTAAGLVVAIPIVLMHSLLSGRVDRLIADTERYAATVLNLLRDK